MIKLGKSDVDQMNLKPTLIRLLNSLALDPELSLSRGSNRSGLSTTAAFLRVRERLSVWELTKLAARRSGVLCNAKDMLVLFARKR